MKVLLRLTEFAKPYWKLFALSLALVLVISGLGVLQPLIVEWVIDNVLATGKFDLLIYGALAIVGAVAIQGGIRFIQRYTMALCGQKVVFDVRNRLYQHLQQLSFSFYDKAQTGQLMSRVTADVETLQRFFSNGLVQIIQSLVTFLITFGVMMDKDWKLTLIAMIPVPFLADRVRLYSTKIRPKFWEIQQKLAVLTATLQENVTGQRVVKAFARKDYEIQKFERDNEALLRENVSTRRIAAFYESTMGFLTELSLAIILWYGGRSVMTGEITPGEMVAFSMLVMQLISPVRMLGFWVSLAQRTAASGERIYEVLDTGADVTNKPGAQPIPRIKGRVTFENVSFSYDGKHMVLEDINLDVKPGETIAILGGTGSGKSTLINLIPRFYDVTGGRILIDGVDIRDVTLDSLRRQIGVVTQETFLFSASLRDNIAYGKPQASPEEVKRAAEAAHIAEFIESLPGGYDTIIGERGVGLSGGQKQRVAIARALLMDARILLLDESTSSVDVETEMRIQEAFSKLLKDRTSFIIAQRLSTVRNADRIIVLDRGRIVEQGTHEQLLKFGGIYTAIYNLQFKPQEELEGIADAAREGR